ncbi:MAG: hypothetical protein HYT89_00790 [Candidatus Omnitrophica bacterium]|nr:hypothetical protein [Candidatus Omnitrophota bacterium]
MKKKILVLMMVAVFAGGAFAFAGCPHGGKPCALSGSESESPCPVTQKFLKKARFYLGNAEAIGLSEEQAKTLRALQADVKKDAIRQGAQMQIFAMDVQAKLSEEKVDVAAVSQMIEEESKTFVEAAKRTVSAYAKMKDTLSAEQKDKAKALWKKKS